MNDKSDSQNEHNRVLEKIQEIMEKSADGDYIYRGECIHSFEICSGLYRAYAGMEDKDFNIEDLQAEILAVAKKYTGKATDFEILAEVQHFGGKTNLIDFTTDYLVALFFACNGFPDEDGRVILLDKTGDMKDWIKYLPLPRSSAIAQKKIFVSPPNGFIEREAVSLITIPANFKTSILMYLQKYHNISLETLYDNDLRAFIQNRGIYRSASAEFDREQTNENIWREAEIPSEREQRSAEKILVKKPIKIFITYAHEDKDEKDELIRCLSVMKREGLIAVWHDEDVPGGSDMDETIFSNLSCSNLLLYLTSAYSLASEACNTELVEALKAGVKVVRIILEHCDWKHATHGRKFLALPKDGVPITRWPDQPEGWQSVVEGIRRVINEMLD